MKMMLGLFMIFCFSLGCTSLTVDDLITDSFWVPMNTRSVVDPEIEDEMHRFEDALGGRSLFDSSEENDDGPVDCFGLSPFLQKVFRWMFQPQSAKKIDVRFYLSTRENRSPAEWIKENGGSFGTSRFESHKNLVIIVHGFMSNSKVFWVKELTNAILDKSDLNVVAVDWGGGSLSWKYWRAVGNTRVVGKELSQFLRKLFAHGLTRAQIHCIGHSLGAHICSFAAQKLGVLGRITGLDPAQPCFNDHGLNVSDAIFVDVIHTNTGLLGRLKSIGIQDFYPNGGRNMPGCALRDSGFLSKLPITRKKLENAICSHGRSYEYLIDSLRSKKCKFWGRQWDLSHKGALTIQKQSCSLKTCVPLGLDSPKFPGKGTYYVPTMDTAPFCIPDTNTTSVMNAWTKIQRKFNPKIRLLKRKFKNVFNNIF